MTTLFRQGAFQGATPSQAFFVKCDAETTTQADIDLGIVNVLVGFAPLKPAEFVVVQDQPEGRHRRPSLSRGGRAMPTVHRQHRPVRSLPELQVQGEVGRPVRRRPEQVQRAQARPPRSRPGTRRATSGTAPDPGKTQVRPDHPGGGDHARPGLRGLGQPGATTIRATRRCRCKNFRKDITIDVFNLQGTLILRLQRLPLLGVRVSGAARAGRPTATR